MYPAAKAKRFYIQQTIEVLTLKYYNNMKIDTRIPFDEPVNGI